MQNKNACVSQMEVPFSVGKMLASKSNTKGIFKRCNGESKELSGYSHARSAAQELAKFGD